MTSSINSKLRFNGCFQFLSSSLDDLLKNLTNDFKNLTQKFDNKVLDLVKQKSILHL